MSTATTPITALTLLCLAPLAAVAANPDGVLELRVIDAQTQQPIAARVELFRAGDKEVRNRGLGVAQLGGHFYVDGNAELGLRRGQYTFDLTSGPEFKPVSGHFEIERRAQDSKTVEMHRVVNLADEGWIGGDLLVDRGGKHLDAALRGEAIAYVPLTAWVFDDDKWTESPTATSKAGAPVSYGPAAARARTDEGDVLLVRPGGELKQDELPTDQPTTLAALQSARDAGLRVVAADAASWRLPVWLAAGVLDAIVVIDPSDLGLDRKARGWGRQPDKSLFPGVRGAARWREAIYFHVLGAGFPMPPAAGTGSAASELPLGQCRVYAKVHERFSPNAWWDALATGEAFVTNGPLLRPIPTPGRTLRLMADSTDVNVALSLTTRSKIEYLEVIKNGELEHSVSLRDLADARGELPAIDCSGAGWFLLRAIAMESAGYERAMTAPYYYQPLGGEPRVSKASCGFFLAWLDEAADVLDDNELATARAFWQSRLDGANAP